MAQSEIKMKMSLDESGVSKTLNRTKARIQNFSKSGVAAIMRFGAAFAGIGLVKAIVGLGTAAAETASKFNAVFGSAAAEMNKRVEELKKTIPATTAEMQNALATFGQMGRSFGLNSAAANEFSVNMVKIAGDLASFHNLNPEEAFLKIRSAISGEFEPLKQLGIVINETTLKQKALELSIWDGVGAMSASQKALTVQALILDQMGTASGDAAATANSAANQIKFLRAELVDTGTEIGTTLLPAIVAITKGLATLIEVAKGAAEAVGSVVGKAVYGDGPSEMDAFRAAAEQSLRRKGELPAKSGARKKAIEEEAKRLKELRDERESANNVTEDQAKAEGKVTEAVTDPKRSQAAKEYEESLKRQLELAGKLSGVISSKPGPKAVSESSKPTEGGAGGSIAIGSDGQPMKARWGTIGTKREFQSRYKSKFGAAPTMADRERMAGLYLAGNDPMSGRKPGAGTAAKKPEDSEAQTLKEMAGSLKVIESTMTE